MAVAIAQLFANLAEDLAAHALPEHSVHAYVFGGCAVHLHAATRASSDVDVELSCSDQVKESEVRMILQALPPVDYDDPDAGPSQLVWDANFNTTFGPLHEDYRGRAHLIESSPGAPLEVWLPSAEDIAISKLGRFADIDIKDVVELLSLPSSSWENFRAWAQEASQYYAGPALDSKILHIRRLLDQRESAS